MRPAPRRSRWVHRPRMRARLYSSWASSTWSLPSELWACSAKMSRIVAVRSTTGVGSSACSRLRSWRGLSSSSVATMFASAFLTKSLSSSILPGPRYEFGCGASRCWIISPTTSTPDGRRSSLSSDRPSPAGITPTAIARCAALGWTCATCCESRPAGVLLPEDADHGVGDTDRLVGAAPLDDEPLDDLAPAVAEVLARDDLEGGADLAARGHRRREAHPLI